MNSFKKYLKNFRKKKLNKYKMKMPKWFDPMTMDVSIVQPTYSENIAKEFDKENKKNELI